MVKKPTMRSLLHEHNILNGFWFVLIEFVLVVLAALFVGVAVLTKGSIVWAVAFLGIAANAATVCIIVIGQMRRGERSNTFAETYSGKGREVIRREHPNLDRHTLWIVIAILVPFLLSILTLIDKLGTYHLTATFYPSYLRVQSVSAALPDG